MWVRCDLWTMLCCKIRYKSLTSLSIYMQQKWLFSICSWSLALNRYVLEQLVICRSTPSALPPDCKRRFTRCENFFGAEKSLYKGGIQGALFGCWGFRMSSLLHLFPLPKPQEHDMALTYQGIGFWTKMSYS